MTDNRTTELREKLNKIIIELDRLEIALDAPASNMTLGENEQEREKLLDGFIQAIAATLGNGTCEIVVKTWEDRGGDEEDTYKYELSCGHTVRMLDCEPLCNCPRCGRRVEHDKD